MSHKVLKEPGPECPRCSVPMQIREHKDSFIPKRDYYKRWYMCKNRKCRTKQVMPHEYYIRVTNELPFGSDQSGHRTANPRDQEDH